MVDFLFFDLFEMTSEDWALAMIIGHWSELYIRRADSRHRA